MALEAPFVGEGQHLVVHTGGVADAEHGHTSIDQLLANPIDRHIALCTHQYLVLAVKRLVDGLYQCGGLSGARRTVYDGHILGIEHLVYGLFLCGVEPRESGGGESEGRGLLRAVEDVTQLRQAVPFRLDDLAEGFEHQPVARLVEIELYAQAVGILYVHQCRGSRQDDHHAVFVHIVHRGGEVEVVQPFRCVLGEEAHGASEFEYVLDVLVFAAFYFDDQLVERVVVAPSHAEGIPAHSALHFPSDAHRLGLLAEGFLLVFILHTQEQFLSLQQGDGAGGVYGAFVHGSLFLFRSMCKDKT